MHSISVTELFFPIHDILDTQHWKVELQVMLG